MSHVSGRNPDPLDSGPQKGLSVFSASNATWEAPGRLFSCDQGNQPRLQTAKQFKDGSLDMGKKPIGGGGRVLEDGEGGSIVRYNLAAVERLFP